MKKSIILGTTMLAAVVSLQAEQLRAPAYPLITHDPYLSIWSMANELNDEATKHWTGADNSLFAFIKINGVSYQLISPIPSQFEEVLPTAEIQLREVKYTYDEPQNDWYSKTFNDKGWKTGKTPFGNGEANPVKANSAFDKNVWYRHEFTLDRDNFENLKLSLWNDDDVEVYINGVLAYENKGYETKYVQKPISAEALKTLKKGKNTLAVHCINYRSGAYIDVGLINEKPIGKPLQKATQTGVKFSATQTIYRFKAGDVDVDVNFTSPLLMNDLDIVSRPASYVTFDITSSKDADIDLYFGISGELSASQASQEVVTSNTEQSSMLIQSVGTKSQKLLNRAGDDLRIDWGYALMGISKKDGFSAIKDGYAGLLNKLNNSQLKNDNKSPSARNTFVGIEMKLGKVSGKRTEHVVVAYNDEYSIQYFGKNLRPWWNREGKFTSTQLLAMAEKDYTRLMKESAAFDTQMRADALKAGGEKYAQLCELAYRQAIAAHKIVASPTGEVFFFSKENNSNGSIGTVDITYPSAPLFILYNTELMKGMLRFIFEYSESGRWSKPFVAHDVGTYPLANGQTYGGDMPVEESGNMLILTAAIAKEDGDLEFVKKHWKTLTIWTNYLKEHGLDPANQLCTDDFAGHFARNVNLSAKAIMGIVSYAQLAKMIGKDDISKQYMAIAKDYVQKWMKMADEGDHYGLVFETENTWSQKYNIVWDKMFKTNVFPQSVIDKELAYYKKKQQAYGLPLDNRRLYSKNDWIIWTATLTSTQEDFQFFVDPIWKYADETSSRVPLSDWYWTDNATMTGFKARSVVGGFFIKILDEKWNGK